MELISSQKLKNVRFSSHQCMSQGGEVAMPWYIVYGEATGYEPCIDGGTLASVRDCNSCVL